MNAFHQMGMGLTNQFVQL